MHIAFELQGAAAEIGTEREVDRRAKVRNISRVLIYSLYFLFCLIFFFSEYTMATGGVGARLFKKKEKKRKPMDAQSTEAGERNAKKGVAREKKRARHEEFRNSIYTRCSEQDVYSVHQELPSHSESCTLTWDSRKMHMVFLFRIKIFYSSLHFYWKWSYISQWTNLFLAH